MYLNLVSMEKKRLYKNFFYYIITQIALASSNFYTVSNKTELNYLNKNFIFSKNVALDQTGY